MAQPVLLIITVGGTAEPVAFSIGHWKPDHTWFLASKETAPLVESKVLPMLAPSLRKRVQQAHITLEMGNAQDIQDLVDQILVQSDAIARWKREHPQGRVVVDITGGYKPMSAASLLCASGWGASISYVGGDLRSKDGLGVVATGQEQMHIAEQHPWDVLQRVALQQALTFLRKNEFGAAVDLLRDTQLKVHRRELKDQLEAMITVVAALDCWDRFDIAGALRESRFALNKGKELALLIGQAEAEKAVAGLQALVPHWEAIEQGRGEQPLELEPTRALLADLLANAKRRMHAGRWDDAVARMYRTVEAAAQWHLHELGIWKKGKYSVEKVPKEVRLRMPEVFKDDRKEFKLGVSAAWTLIGHMAPERAKAFKESGLGGERSNLLKARNNSILAHGTRPMEEKDANALLEAIEILLGEKEPLPRSPFQAA